MIPADAIVNLCRTIDLAEIKAQLQSDLGRAGITVDFKNDDRPELLAQKLVQLLENLLKTQPEAVLQLLYLADVSEVHARKLIAKYPDDEAGIFGFLLLKRTIEKIEWRRKYS